MLNKGINKHANKNKNELTNGLINRLSPQGLGATVFGDCHVLDWLSPQGLGVIQNLRSQNNNLLYQHLLNFSLDMLGYLSPPLLFMYF